jgi:hypothetical protein
MEAFISLSPTSENVRVYPANWSKQSKSKGKGHTVRCIRRRRSESGAADGEVVSALEVGNVDSIEKVYRIITEHMKMGVSTAPLSLVSSSDAFVELKYS